ncbi:hypothetical protein GDO81_014952 [Engystomops pustulosus]|uniref:Ig-like domain-containing protein n=2 Tax=Engystomops pustulosus TaxID=76066 RepID=A0AAV7AML0_ENGPU|nr:hypothetical protein GDO81_014952 [Engystomops pustulosus]KAG8560392.1 hypothetical protein GDO81_014952 [Engystomops pustulosus]
MKLGIFLCLIALMQFFSGEALSYRNISGLSNSYINLRALFPSSPVPVIEVMWYHKTTDGNEVLLAKFQDGRVIDRLSSRYMVEDGGRVLKIQNGSKNDNGVYKDEATLQGGGLVDDVLYLTVYDPVPIPDVIPQVKRIGDKCHVAVQCSVPSNRSDIYYTWKYRHADKEYQKLNDTGGTIRMTVPIDHLDMKFMCTAHNPADQKNATTHIKDCEDEVPNQSIIIKAVVPVVVVVILTVAIWKVFPSIYNKCRQDMPGNAAENVSLRSLEGINQL